MSTKPSSFSYDPEKHIYRLDGQVIPSCTQILSEGGLVDTQWFTEESRDLGTRVHLATQFHDEGDLDESSLSPLVAAYLDQYKLFLKESGFKTMAIEYVTYSPTLKVGTVIDRLGWLTSCRVVIDIKTGQKNRATGPQTAFHKFAWEEHNPGKRIFQRYGLYLDPDKSRANLVEYKDENDIQYFRAAAWVAQWRGKK